MGYRTLIILSQVVHTNWSIALQWSANVIMEMWDYGMDCWKERNRFIYGDTGVEPQTTILHLDLDGLIQYLYSLKEMVNPRDSIPRHRNCFGSIKTVHIAVQAWHHAGGITLEDRA